MALKQTRLKTLGEIFHRGFDATRYYRSDRLLAFLLMQQRSAAIRNIRPRHFWRFRKDLSNPNPVLRESTNLHRKYDIRTIFYPLIKHSDPTRPIDNRGVHTEIQIDFNIDLAEGVRLGEQFKIVDSDREFPFKFYLVKSGDLFQWNRSIYEVDEVKPQFFYEPLQRWVIWNGQAKLIKSDAHNPLIPIQPLSSDPQPDIESTLVVGE